MHPLEAWRDLSKTERQAEIRQLFASPAAAVRDYASLVTVPNHWGVFASIGPNFSFAVFGRDSIETAEDLLPTHKDLAHDIIITLCRLQGQRTDYQSEEEPGKIHHEYRCKRFNGHEVPERSQHILYDLQHVWGGIGTDETIYYGAYDATPLFIRLVGQYIDQYGSEILDEELTHRTGHKLTVRTCTVAALRWLAGKLEEDPNSLLAYKRLNPVGLLNQVWKDSVTSHIHEDGSLPNYNEPVVSIALQGYAYDALQIGIRLGLGEADERDHWHELAEVLRFNTVSKLWMPAADYFAQGYDIGPDGNPRLLRTITSDPGCLLDTGLLYDLPEAERHRYVDGIVSKLFSPELLTDVGIRCRSPHTWDLVDYIDYHGPNAVWPKETFDIAKGLRRAGRHEQARDLEDRIQRSLEKAGEFVEFFYVSRDGTVWYDTDEALKHFESESHGHSIPTPEPGQAWTIAAAIRIAHNQRRSYTAHHQSNDAPSRHVVQTTAYAYGKDSFPGSLN